MKDGGIGSSGTDTSSVKADLIDATEAGKLCLELKLDFCTAGVMWRAKYAFLMSPIGVSETDILTAQVSDMQEEIDALRRELSVVAKPHFMDVVLASSMLEQVQSVSAQWARQVGRWFVFACKAGWKTLFEPRPVQIGQC